MKKKRTAPSPLYFILLICLLCRPLVFAFQLADGSPPVSADNAKYIFYWGNMQCDLTPTNKYTGKFTCSTTDFRQMLHHTPYLWSSAGMAASISFQMEGLEVTATRGGQDYLALISLLDESIGQKIQAGQVLQVTGLSLDAQLTGRIDIIIEEPKSTESTPAYRPTPAANMLNTRFLQQVIWGREDIYENTNRDFFSEAEFWQTVQQLPYLEWAMYAKPQPVRASIRLHDLGEASFGLRAELEPAAYRQMVERLANYRHLVQPGSLITLTLHTTEQHDRLFEKNMYIVSANDPRLALRRNRDTHTLKIEWGSWEETIEYLYLLELKDGQGDLLPVDPPATLRRTIRQDKRAAMLTSRPKFWIDGQFIPEMAFQLHMPNRSVHLGPGEALPDSLVADFDTTSRELYPVQLDSLQAPGYSIPPLTFSLNYYYLGEILRVRNTLNSLLAAPGTAFAKLHAPSKVGVGYAVDLEILNETDAKLSIFKPDGENIFTLDNKYPVGRHTVEIPRIVFRQPGKYYLFLNTIFGVAKQEIVLE